MILGVSLISLGREVNDSPLGVNITGTLNSGAQVNLNSMSVTVTYAADSRSDYLRGTEYNFNLTTPITGIEVTANAYGAVTMTAQLLISGVPTGEIKTITLPVSSELVTFGSPLDSWGLYGFADAQLNSEQFGVQIQAFQLPDTLLGYANVKNLQIIAWVAPNATDFNYIGGFHAQNGLDYSLALDALGNWYLENTTTDASVLNLALETGTAGCYASGATVYDRGFVCMSNLFGQLAQGADIGRQYNFTQGWWDKITQEGPGAPPSVTASQASGDVANITAVSVTANVATITAANSYTAGEVGTFSGLVDGSAPVGSITGLNGQTLVVLSTGLSGSQFEVAYDNGSVTTGTQSQVTSPPTVPGATFQPQYTYPILTITQPPANPVQFGNPLDCMLWSAGPGSVSSGNTITVYYVTSWLPGTLPDTYLVNAFNSGYPVYVYMSGCPFGNGTYQVTSIGNALPVSGSGLDHWRFYFTYNVATSDYQQVTHPGGASYEVTQGTVNLSTPVPGLAAGSQVSISGVTPSTWDGVYPIVEALNAGAYNITQSELDTTGTATYTWVLTSGIAPAAGQLVTVTNTLNANGILNVTDALIATATGVDNGTFTITGFPPPTTTQGPVVEAGQATTAGTEFIIDPGAPLNGNVAGNPIYGNGTGGTLTVVGQASSGTLPIGAGTYQLCQVFVTRNDTWTMPSPPTTFSVAQGANYIQVSNLLIGPPNVIARLILVTQPGQNGIAGANFYTTTVPTIFTVGGIKYTSSSFLVNDNTTTTAKFTFSSAVLQESDEVDVEGNDLFNLIEIGNPAWVFQYADRTFYGGCLNRVNNISATFNGGYIQPSSGASPLPSAWNVDANYNFTNNLGTGPCVSLTPSPIFGDSLYVVNNTGQDQPIIGMVTQNAFQDAYNVPILQTNTPYSVRVTARSPSGSQIGNIVVDLVNSNQGVYGSSYGSFTIPLSSLTTTMATYTGTLLTGTGLAFSVPPGLLLRAYGTDIHGTAATSPPMSPPSPAPGGDYQIDRVEIFPTNQPVLTNQVWVSYPQNPEQVDGVTGKIILGSYNQDQVYGALVLHDQLTFKKKNSMVECSDAANEEPSNWSTREVSQRIGACSPNAFDYGDEWDLTLHETGIYVFSGAAPMPISRELNGMAVPNELWDTINWAAKQTFWLRNDLRARRFYVGVAMKTPNFWLPYAPVNANPTSPNVILMCNYEGCPTANELEEAKPAYVTMFGTLKAVDMRRKWSIWQIASPYAAVIEDGIQNFETLYICSNYISRLLAPDIWSTDNGQLIAPLYTTASIPNSEQAMQNNLGMGQKLASKFSATIDGVGAVNQLTITHRPNTLQDTKDAVKVRYVPALTGVMNNNIEWNGEVRFQRLFTEFAMNQPGAQVVAAGYFELGELNIFDIIMHPWGSRRGISI